MAAQISLKEAQTHMNELVDKLAPGEELVLTENDQPVAKLVGEQPVGWQRPPPGFAKGMITIVADDLEHLEGFEDYMSEKQP